MTISYVPGPPLFMTDDAFRSEAIGIREISLSLASRSRIIYELASGKNPHASTDAPASILNPEGDIGHNHSGPPYGACFLQPIAWITRREANAGNVQQPTDWPVADLTVSTHDSGITIDWVIWQRRFAHLPVGWVAPLSRAYLTVFARRKTGTATSLAVSMAALTADGQRIGDVSRTDSIAMTSTTASGYLSAAFVDLHGGRNRVSISLTSTDAGTSTAPVVTSLALCNIAKRSHI